MALKCNVDGTLLVDTGRKSSYGGWVAQCPQCSKMWAMVKSMTGPELVGMRVNENDEFTDDYSYGDSPIDTSSSHFWVALLVIILVAFLSK
jgi:cytochrome c2